MGHFSSFKEVMVMTLVYLVVELRDMHNSEINQIIIEALLSTNENDNPKYIFHHKMKDTHHTRMTIPDKIASICNEKKYFQENKELILPITHMANYYYDYISQDNNKLSIANSLIVMMITKGANLTPVSENTFPFWRYYTQIFSDVNFNCYKNIKLTLE